MFQFGSLMPDANEAANYQGSAFHSGPEVIKLFSCSTQISMKFSPLIHVKMPTIVGILTCMSGKKNILGLKIVSLIFFIVSEINILT